LTTSTETIQKVQGILMKEVLNKLKESKLSQRILKLGIAYVAIEVVFAIGAILFFVQDVAS
jgi:hypothetical protein